jgi:hypothetical protein
MARLLGHLRRHRLSESLVRGRLLLSAASAADCDPVGRQPTMRDCKHSRATPIRRLSPVTEGEITDHLGYGRHDPAVA